MVDVNVAWAAGLFEGEGCVYIPAPAPSGARYVHLVMSSTDLDVLERFRDIMDCGRIFPHKGKAATSRRARRHKQLWAWRLARAEEVVHVLELLRPFAGDRRGTKMDEALLHLYARRGVVD